MKQTPSLNKSGVCRKKLLLNELIRIRNQSETNV